jgi:putative FmdB family regulatory protein
MPIYEYRCSKCGFQDEYLQKVSEPPLTVCPSCGKRKFEKLLSAAGFQLKGSGWYATDFKGGSQPAAAKAQVKSEATAESKGEAKAESKAEAKTESKAEAKAESKAEAKSGVKSDSAEVKKTPASTTH